MKYLNIIILLSFLILTSCEKILDTEPLDKYTSDAVWSSYNLATGYMYTCYSGILGNLTNWSDDINTKNMYNELWGGSTGIKTDQIDKGSDMGWNNFGNIRKVNLALQNLKVSSFEEVQKNTLMGEAYFLRSIIYFTEVRKFGGVQIVKDVLDPNSDFQIARSTMKESYDFVLSDLDSAAILLPEPGDIERGRASKAAAYALKMRVALQAGAYLNDNSYYQQIITAGNKLFAYTQYKLDSYANLFNSYSTAIISPENILVYERLSTNTSFSGTPMQSLFLNTDNSSKTSALCQSLFPLAETCEGWINFSPTQSLVNNYLVTDADGNEKAWDVTSYMTSGSNVNEKMYQHRDKRFYASIVYDSTKVYNNWLYFRTDGNGSNANSQISGGVTSGGGVSTGYMFKKYLYQDQGKLWYSDPVDYCYSALRLGEAYLNYAEAALALGDEPTARTYMTKTYQGHGGFTNTITASGNDLWSAYKRERTVEMVLENGDIYYSLLRWGVQKMGGLNSGYASSGYVIPDLNGMMEGIKISQDGRNYSIFNLNAKNNLPLLFTAKRYLFPVPYSKIQALPLLTQNEGWQ